MSHFSYLKTQVKNLSALLEALTSFGFVPEIHLDRAEVHRRRKMVHFREINDLIPEGEEPTVEVLQTTAFQVAKLLNCNIEDILVAVPLYGYRGDQRKDVAHVRVPREQIRALGGGACNDLGLVFDRESGEYQLIISQFDRTNRNGPLGPTFATRLNVAYGKAVSIQAVRAKGYDVVSEAVQDGKLVLKCVRSQARTTQTSQHRLTTSRR